MLASQTQWDLGGVFRSKMIQIATQKSHSWDIHQSPVVGLFPQHIETLNSRRIIPSDSFVAPLGGRPCADGQVLDGFEPSQRWIL